jgi:hypothetical protein
VFTKGGCAHEQEASLRRRGAVVVRQIGTRAFDLRQRLKRYLVE